MGLQGHLIYKDAAIDFNALHKTTPKSCKAFPTAPSSFVLGYLATCAHKQARIASYNASSNVPSIVWKKPGVKRQLHKLLDSIKFIEHLLFVIYCILFSIVTTLSFTDFVLKTVDLLVGDVVNNDGEHVG